MDNQKPAKAADLLKSLGEVHVKLDLLQASVDVLMRTNGAITSSKVIWAKKQQVEVLRKNLRESCRGKAPDYQEKQRRKQMRNKIKSLELDIGRFT